MTIDIEQAPALTVYGEHASKLARLTRARRSLVPRLLYAPRPALHAIAAWLYFTERAEGADLIVAEIIDNTDPRSLLLEAIPSAPPRLYRSLDRAGDRARNRDFYSRLSNLASLPVGKVLLRNGPLHTTRLHLMEKVIACDDVVISLFCEGVLPESLSIIGATQTLITWLRASGLPIEQYLHLATKSRVSALRKVLEKGLSSLSAPPVPFEMALPFRIIMSVSELQTVGRQFANCLDFSRFGSSGPFELLAGATVYLTADKPEIVAALQRAGPDLWYLAEIKGPKNCPVDEKDQTMLINALRDAGVMLLDQSPAQALRHMIYYCDRQKGDDLLEDVDGDIAEDFVDL